MRDVVVTIDTTVEYNNLAKGSNIVDFLKIDKGLRLTIIDNSFKIFYFDEYADNNLNGVHLEFYLPSNMPKEKGSYLNNEKDGEWFYWSRKGILLKKELWKKGKLIKKT